MVAKRRYFIATNDVETLVFDWGKVSITVALEASGAGNFSAGIVVLAPGGGYPRHNHPGAEEIIEVISGRGIQMEEDENGNPLTRDARPGRQIQPAKR